MEEITANTLCFDIASGSIGIYNGADFVYCFGTARCVNITKEQLVACKGIPLSMELDLRSRFIPQNKDTKYFQLKLPKTAKVTDMITTELTN